MKLDKHIHVQHHIIVQHNRYSCALQCGHLSALECESGEVVWVLLVPAQPQQWQLFGVLVEYRRMLKVPARITDSEYLGVKTCANETSCIRRTYGYS